MNEVPPRPTPEQRKRLVWEVFMLGFQHDRNGWFRHRRALLDLPPEDGEAA
jgi:hypothetical protein